MQPRVTIQALATVWLVVVSLVGAAVTHRLSHDQYFPASPHRHSRVQRNQIRDWRDHDPAEDQPLDLWIGSRRSISAEEPPALPYSSTKFTEKDFPLEKNNVSSKRDYPFSAWQRWLLNIAGTEFAADKVDYGYEMPQTLSREAVILPSDLLDDPFVADDTFQDQGPGSVEIYKLDLSKENVLLTATTPTNDLLTRNKSKSPKKMSNLNSKTKTTEVKSTTTTPSPKIHHGQSNVFEEQRTETPSVNTNSFGVGGVPELQVGCEGLEASSSSHKAKRSIDTPDKEQRQAPILQNVTPVVLDLDYEEEEEDEEMDELLKLKKLETTTKRNQPNRGDMDASHLNSDHLDESWRPDKLPVRGDLGESRRPSDTEIKNREEKAKWMLSVSADDGAGKNRGRRLLWLAEANTEGFAYGKSEQKRAKRSIEWGFGEDEGVVSSNELQTMNARRRKHDMRYHRNAPRKRDQYHEVNSDVDKIRREYEERLVQKRREEEERRLRQQQQGGRSTPSGWMEEEERRRDEMQTRQYEEYLRRMNNIPAPRTGDDETLRRQMEEQQRQEAARNRTQEMARRNEEDRRRREEEERRRRLQEEEETGRSQSRWQEENLRRMNSRTPYNEQRRQRPDDEEMRRREEEARRQEWYRKQEEAQRRKDEEERKRQEDDRKREEEQLAQKLAERRRQEEEEKRRQQPPSNLMGTKSQSRHPNDIERRDPDEERRAWEQEERRKEQKLREYIARNRPINVNRSNRRTEEEKRRYRPEDNKDSRMNANRNAEEYRRQIEEQRRRQEEEQRRKQEEEQRRRQEEEQRRRQEEEQRRKQEEEQRRRQEEEQYRQQEEEKKLQDYIRRNQPVNMRNNQSTSRDLFEERRLIEQARRRDRYPDPGAGRHRGPSVSMYIDPRSSPEEVWRRQQETARRQEEERRRVREREEKERQLREEQMRKEAARREQEAARREQEARREQSRRYEEERKRLEVARSREEQRRQEMLRERSRSEAERTRQPEATRRPTSYQDPRLMEHRRRQDSQPIPSNLARNEEERKERERQRQLEQERRRQQENRWREHRRKESEQERSRQELARLSSLPVSARIIVRPINFTPSPGSPTVLSRNGIGNEVDFTGINPHREGVKVAKFPVPPTPRPPVPSPRPCVWAVVHCCSSNNSRLTKCFESLGCPGINWDPNPCSNSIVEAARAEVMKFYESQ